MDFSDLYSEKILHIVANAPVCERLNAPDSSAKATARVCGSRIEVDINVSDDQIVTAFGSTISACALGQASSAIVATHIIGTSLDELRALRAQLSAMLVADGEPPKGKWDDFKYLQPVRDYPARHGSTLLIFDAILKAAEGLKAK